MSEWAGIVEPLQARGAAPAATSNAASAIAPHEEVPSEYLPISWSDLKPLGLDTQEEEKIRQFFDPANEQVRPQQIELFIAALFKAAPETKASRWLSLALKKKLTVAEVLDWFRFQSGWDLRDVKKPRRKTTNVKSARAQEDEAEASSVLQEFFEVVQRSQQAGPVGLPLGALLHTSISPELHQKVCELMILFDDGRHGGRELWERRHQENISQRIGSTGDQGPAITPQAEEKARSFLKSCYAENARNSTTFEELRNDFENHVNKRPPTSTKAKGLYRKTEKEAAEKAEVEKKKESDGLKVAFDKVFKEEFVICLGELSELSGWRWRDAAFIDVVLKAADCQPPDVWWLDGAMGKMNDRVGKSTWEKYVLSRVPEEMRGWLQQLTNGRELRYVILAAAASPSTRQRILPSQMWAKALERLFVRSQGDRMALSQGDDGTVALQQMARLLNALGAVPDMAALQASPALQAINVTVPLAEELGNISGPCPALCRLLRPGWVTVNGGWRLWAGWSDELPELTPGNTGAIDGETRELSMVARPDPSVAHPIRVTVACDSGRTGICEFEFSSAGSPGEPVRRQFTAKFPGELRVVGGERAICAALNKLLERLTPNVKEISLENIQVTSSRPARPETESKFDDPEARTRSSNRPPVKFKQVFTKVVPQTAKLFEIEALNSKLRRPPPVRNCPPTTRDTIATMKRFLGQKLTMAQRAVARLGAENRALLDEYDLLVTAPTGAGKTGIAQMCMEKILGDNRHPGRSTDKELTHIVYLAPTKALVAEMVGKFKTWLSTATDERAMSNDDDDDDEVPKKTNDDDDEVPKKTHAEEELQNPAEVEGHSDDDDDKPTELPVGDIDETYVDEELDDDKAGDELVLALPDDVAEFTSDTNTKYSKLLKSQIIVATPQKWNVFSRMVDTSATEAHEQARLRIVRNTALIVIDEIHNIGEQDVLEAIIARFRCCAWLPLGLENRPRIVGLSATINATSATDLLAVIRDESSSNPRLGSHLPFGEEYRPQPLNVRFTHFTPTTSLIEVVRKIVESDLKQGTRKVLVFTRTRGDADDFCEQIQQQLNGSNATKHHAGLAFNERKKNEESFRDHPLWRVMVATSTLAVGVNLPADTVIICGTQQHKWDILQQKHLLITSPRASIMQMFGRAGRGFSAAQNEARCYLVAENEERMKVVGRSLVADEPPLTSSLERFALDHLNGELGRGIKTFGNALRWVKKTWWVKTRRELSETRLVGWIHQLADARLLTHNSDGVSWTSDTKLEATKESKELARYGVSVETFKRWKARLEGTGSESALLLVSKATEFDEFRDPRGFEQREVDNLLRLGLRQGLLQEDNFLRSKPLALLVAVRLEVDPMPKCLERDYCKLDHNTRRIVRCLDELAKIKGLTELRTGCQQLNRAFRYR